MVAASFLSTLLLLALAVAAKPVEKRTSLPSLSFVKRLGTGLKNIIKLDQLRLFNLLGFEVVAPADNRAVSYVASVGVGFPPTFCK
jgi:hypothetical protein